MVLRVHDVGKWQVSKVGEAMNLRGEGERRVRLEVNCPAPTRFDVLTEGGQLTFLGIVQGLETIEFLAPGVCAVVPTSEDEVWYFTSDGDSVAMEFVDAVNLATLANRRVRNPELERMMYKMEQNITRRLATQAEEMAAAAARREKEQDDAGEVGDRGTADADAAESGAGATVPDAGAGADDAADTGAGAGDDAAGATKPAA